MRMELIQPFINAADAVLSETLACPISVSDISMNEEAYQRRANAVLIEISGDIEGRVIFDVEDDAAMKVACTIKGARVFGRMCFQMITGTRVPEAMAAST